MDMPIRNITDLQGEILRLKQLERDQSVAIGQRFSTFSATISTLGSLFPRNVNADGTKSSFFDQDLVGILSRFLLPLTLNKTIFRNSGFIVKTIVSLVSQKASHLINEDLVVGLWDKAKSLFKSKTKDVTQPAHKGVPPLSETA